MDMFGSVCPRWLSSRSDGFRFVMIFFHELPGIFVK